MVSKVTILKEESTKSKISVVVLHQRTGKWGIKGYKA